MMPPDQTPLRVSALTYVHNTGSANARMSSTDPQNLCGKLQDQGTCWGTSDLITQSKHTRATIQENFMMKCLGHVTKLATLVDNHPSESQILGLLPVDSWSFSVDCAQAVLLKHYIWNEST